MENLNYSTVNSIFSLASKPTVYTNNANVYVCSIVILKFFLHGLWFPKDKGQKNIVIYCNNETGHEIRQKNKNVKALLLCVLIHLDFLVVFLLLHLCVT